VANTRASGIYFSKHALINHRDTSAPSICVGIANSTIACSSASAQLKLKNLPPSACQGHIMPSFTRTLVGIAPLCNANLTVIFTKHAVKAYDQAGATILEGWHDPGGANDWQFPVVNSDHNRNEDSLFPFNDKLTIIPPPNPPPEPLPRQQHQSSTLTGTTSASSTRSRQPEWYSLPIESGLTKAW
jgi:hypothetical protein